MKIRLWPYKFHSEGAKNLQLALQGVGVDCLRVRTDGRYKPRADHLIINWGSSTGWPWRFPDCGELGLNEPCSVRTAANKLETFRASLIEGGGATMLSAEGDLFNVPAWTVDKRMATHWVATGKKVYCRKQLTGHSGSGIVVASSIEELVDAPLYTVGIEVKGEYRVHVFRNPQGDYKVVDVQKKRRRDEALENESLNMDVRNLAGGWVFARNQVALGEPALEQARAAVEALGLDFGAVDLVLEKRTERPVVLEVNSAPGISSPTTLAAYVEAIKCYLI